MTKKVFIAGMTCGHCASHVEGALKGVPGVKSAKVNLEGKFATVELDNEIDAAKIKTAIEAAGYEVTGIE